MSENDYPANEGQAARNAQNDAAGEGQTDEEIAAEIAAANAGEPAPQPTPKPTPEPNPGGPAAAIGGEAAEFLALREENAALKDQVLRLAADLENMRRRAEREKGDAGRYAIANFARDLLSVSDNFERALAAAPGEAADLKPEAVAGLLTGVRMTENELQAVFQRHGVKQIQPKGEKFDPNLHQAVAQAPSADVPAGRVADVAQSGFVIGERVLRAAMVVVSTGSPAGAAPQAPDNTGETTGARLDKKV
ncbi:MAG: nucleotide exchange factor GrpE [Pseudomonadota bacterium]